MKYSKVPWKLLTGQNAEAKYSAMDIRGNIRRMTTLYEQIARESGVMASKRKKEKKKAGQAPARARNNLFA